MEVRDVERGYIDMKGGRDSTDDEAEEVENTMCTGDKVERRE